MRSFQYRQGNKTFWALLPLAVVSGLSLGFAVPLVASHHAKGDFEPARVQGSEKSVTKVVQIVPEPSAYDVARDLELEKLVARNRRLEGLIAGLRQRNAKAADQPLLDERGPQQ